MSLLLDILYALGLLIAAPFLFVKSRRTGKYRTDFAARLGKGPDILPTRAPETKLLLLHCVSVGELLSVQTLIARLLAANPNLHIVISTGTDTGTARAKALFPPTATDPKHNPRVHLVRYPLDFSFAVRRFFNRTRPDAIVLVELETWPNFLALAKKRRIPVAIINGRISQRSFPRYQLIRPIMAAMLRRTTWIGVQTEAIAKRFLALGARPQNLHVIPTLKYDNAHITSQVPDQAPLAQAMGLLPAHKLFVAGSTGPGEEKPILETYLALKEKHPELRLAIVPRHPEVVPQVIKAIERHNLTVIKRTQRPDQPTPNSQFPIPNSSVFLLDTMGELRKLYALAFAVFVGRSMVKLGGSDMIEVAALGKPCCFGPHTSNFAEVAELLVAEQAAVVVRDATDLTQILHNWLNNLEKAHETGLRAQALIAAKRGSTDKYVTEILNLLKSH